jgi:hypothetical protein
MIYTFYHPQNIKSNEPIGYSGNIQYIIKQNKDSFRVLRISKNLSQDVSQHPNSQRCWENLEFSGNPDIYGPHHDCGMCGGGGCSRCR